MSKHAVGTEPVFPVYACCAALITMRSRACRACPQKAANIALADEVIAAAKAAGKRGLMPKRYSDILSYETK